MTLIFFSHHFLSSGRYPTYEESSIIFQPPSHSRGKKRETTAQWKSLETKPCRTSRSFLALSVHPGNQEIQNNHIQLLNTSFDVFDTDSNLVTAHNQLVTLHLA